VSTDALNLKTITATVEFNNCMTFTTATQGSDVPTGWDILANPTPSFPPTPPQTKNLTVLLNQNTGTGFITGANQQFAVLNFTFTASSPCKMCWDATGGIPLTPHTNVVTDADIRIPPGGTGTPTTLTFDPVACKDICIPQVCGTSIYFNTTPSARPIESVTVNSATATPNSDLTDTNGDYCLSYPSFDPPTVTASRVQQADDLDAITGADLVLILKYVAAALTLTNDQKRAANVTGDTSGGADVVSGADATGVARWLVFFTTNIGNTAQWVFNFDPSGANTRDSYTYSAPLACQQDLDIEGYFLGDANGTWPNPNPKPLPQVDAAITLQVSESHGGEFTVSLNGDAKVGPIESLIYTLSYDASAVEYLGSAAEPSTRDYFFLDNSTEAGVVHAVAAGYKGDLASSGRLFTARFRFTGGSRSTRIGFRRLSVNDGEPGSLPEIEVSRDGGPSAVLPRQLTIASSPNPFNPTTRIDYAIPAGMDASSALLRIYDMSGRVVRTLLDGRSTAGYWHAVWNGRDAAGATVSAGVYVARLEVGGQRVVQKLTLVK
jgi:hypothetical protein